KPPQSKRAPASVQSRKEASPAGEDGARRPLTRATRLTRALAAKQSGVGDATKGGEDDDEDFDPKYAAFDYFFPRRRVPRVPASARWDMSVEKLVACIISGSSVSRRDVDTGLKPRETGENAYLAARRVYASLHMGCLGGVTTVLADRKAANGLTPKIWAEMEASKGAIMEVFASRKIFRYTRVGSMKRGSGNTNALAFGGGNDRLILASAHLADSSEAYTKPGNLVLCDVLANGWPDGRKEIVRLGHDRVDGVEDEEYGAHVYIDSTSQAKINASINDLAFSPDGTILFTVASRIPTIKAWHFLPTNNPMDLTRSEEPTTPGRPLRGMRRVAVGGGSLLDDGTVLVVGAALDGGLPLWVIQIEPQTEEYTTEFLMVPRGREEQGWRVATDV
ncbi:hypothetical protein HK104_007131, partial [Borealophlyctis nickersoniae]